MRNNIRLTALIGAFFLFGVSANAQSKSCSSQLMSAVDLATPAPTGFTPATPPRPLGSSSGVTSYDCVHRAYYFYDNPLKSGNSCGLMYIYCEADPYQQGCQTAWYNEYVYCGCP
jgi:hypothetical protein